jgi:hypothetical protein
VGGGGAADDVAGQRAGDGAVAVHLRWSAGIAEQGVVGYHQADLDRPTLGGRLAGESFDQGVGHDLIAGPLIPGGFEDVGVGAQRGPGAHSVLMGVSESAIRQTRGW